MTTVRNGLKPRNNDEFVRFWFEVCNTDTFYNPTDYIQAIHSGKNDLFIMKVENLENGMVMIIM